jgi:hypothetical protein
MKYIYKYISGQIHSYAIKMGWIYTHDNNDVDSLFNRFINNYLRIVHTSFPLRKVRERSKSNQWITTGIKTSCIHRGSYIYLVRIVTMSS